MSMNILITGKINSGKSTLINRILEINNFEVKGFRSNPFFEGSERTGFYICPADLKQEWSQAEKERHMIGRILGYKQVKPSTEIFETLGVDYLKEACDGESIILMDELGIIEKEAYAFQRTVMECLDSRQLVICSIRDEQSEFLDQVRAHRSSLLFRVDENNRNALVEKVSRLIDLHINE